MWYASLLILKYILPSHPAFVKTLGKFYKQTLNFMTPSILWTCFHLRSPFNQDYLCVLWFWCWKGTIKFKVWDSNGGDNWGWSWKNWQEQSFVGDNPCESISENWSAPLEKLDYIQKIKCLKQLTKSICD